MPKRDKPMYPIFMDIEGKPCLVAGGGKVAERKAESLLECGARVVVVAPEATGRISQLAAEGRIGLEKRGYVEGEAGAYFLVIAATDDEKLNRRVSEDARLAGRPVNVVDVPELCGFYVPSVVRRGGLQIAISTGGAAPAMAKKIREDLESIFPPAYAKLIDRLRDFRETLIDRVPAESERAGIMSRIVSAPEIKMFLEGDEAPLDALLRECV